MKYIATVNTTDRDTLSGILEKLQKHANFKVNGLFASDFQELQASSPKLFADIAELVKNGRWCPYAGAFCGTADYNSVSLIKSCMYSAEYFRRSFGTEYKVFHGKKIYCNSFPQTVYSSLFDSAVLDEEKNDMWLSCTDGFRTLVFSAKNTVEAQKCDDAFISENEFETYEEHSEEMFSSALSLKTVCLPFSFDEADDTQQALLNAEAYAVYCNKADNTAIKTAWRDCLSGKTASLSEELTQCNISPDSCDMFRVVGDGIILSEVKFSEDNSGDVIIRVRETAGTEKGAYIMCDRLNAGFRFEIMPYEIQTFRIKGDGTGTVFEIYICE